jgi:chromosome partitioning protein
LKTVVISNRKGGSAKTTTALNLASQLAKHHSVLLIDLDTQGHSRFGLGVKGITKGGIHSIFNNEVTLSENFVPTKQHNLTLAPADEHFDVFELSNLYGILKKRFQEESIGEFFDYCVIDTAPTYDGLLKNALDVADVVIVPTVPHHLGQVSVGQMMRAIYQTTTKSRDKPPFVGILPVMFNPHIVSHKDVISNIKKIYGKDKIFSPISIDINLAKQFKEKTPVVLNENSRGANSYINFTKELVERINKYVI